MSILRCRKGDMAMILRGPYVGQFVDVLEFVGTSLGAGPVGFIGEVDDVWEISAPRNSKPHPGATTDKFIARDSSLLPIRPGDLDEAKETSKVLEMTK